MGTRNTSANPGEGVSLQVLCPLPRFCARRRVCSKYDREVRKSKKVIAVISKTFFSSHWCNFELQQAIYQHIKKGNNGVIVIKIDNVSTEMFPKAIQTKSFIDYSNRVERPFFKTRLLKVLESSSNAYKKEIIPMQIDG